VHVEKSTARVFKHERVIRAPCRARRMALGTMDLLMRNREHLPNVSVAARRGRAHECRVADRRAVPGHRFDMSKGIAIGSGIISTATPHRATRYSKGSDVLGLMATMLVNGKAGSGSPRGSGGVPASDQVLSRGLAVRLREADADLLVMQTLDATLKFQANKRRWYWPFTKLLTSHGQRIPTNIPQANAFAERAAQEMGGIAITSSTEILFDLPMTGTASAAGDGQGCRVRRDRRAASRTAIPTCSSSTARRSART